MFSILLLVTLSLAVLNGSQKEYHCCEEKIVNGITYLLVDNPDLKPDPICINDCIYQVENDPSTFFCFKHGMYEPECVDLNTTPPQIETTESDAIIVTGEWKNELLYANGTKFCELPDFPERRTGHSQNGLTTCAGNNVIVNNSAEIYTSCFTLKDGGWTDNEVSLLGNRTFHVSFLRPDGKIQLMSSSRQSSIEDGKSTEVVDLNAKTSVPGYDLNYDHGSARIYGPCAIQPGEYVVLTGNENEVYDINGFVETLPSLNTPREGHGCGHYKNNDNEVVFLVTGGRDTNLKTLDTTELLIEGAASWIISEKKLPTGRSILVGVSINNKIFMTGGIDDSVVTAGFLDEVIEFNTDTEEWSLVDNMREGRRGHAASIVDINIAEQFCLL